MAIQIKKAECRFCEHLKNQAPARKRFIGACEHMMEPDTCGNFRLAGCYQGHDPRTEVTASTNYDERVFILTRLDVVLCAKEMGLPEEVITDEVFYNVKKGVEWGLESWSDVMKTAINYALKS